MKKRIQTNTLKPGSRVICYVRDSGGSRQVKSVDDQLAEIKSYCDANGLILFDTFADRRRSGTTIARRDELERMRFACSAGNYADGLIVWNFSRLGRNKDEVEEVKRELRKQGLIIHSINEKIPEGRIGQVVEGLYDWQAEEQSIKTSEDTIRGLSHRARSGYIPGGSTPRGYRAVREIIAYNRDDSPRIGTRWEIDPELGPLVTLAFKMRAEGKSLNEILRSPAGILYKTKGSWVTFFRNESYLGIIKCGETKVENHKTIPPLIDRPTWEAVQNLRKMINAHAPGNMLHPRRYNSPSLLSGLAVCIHCGTPINREVTHSKTKAGTSIRWFGYVCGAKKSKNWHACEGKQIQAAKADRAVVDAVLNQVLTVDHADELIKQVQASYANNGEILRQETATQAALSNCEKAISRLLDTIESTDSATAKNRLKERETERARLQFELSIISSQRNAAEIEITSEVLSDTLDIWRGKIESARDQNDIRNLQRYLRRFLVKIELGYHTARLWYTFNPETFADSDVLRLSVFACRDR